MIVLAIPTLRNFDGLTDCVWSALAGTVPPTVLVIDNSGGQCPDIPGAEIVPGRQPQSVAKAWNDAVTLAGGCDLILANDDIVFAPDTIAALLDLARRTPRAGIVSAIEGARFSLFWLNPAAYAAVGPFDEGFVPAYFEDNDYARRLHLAGWELPVAPSAVTHAGSRTLALAGPGDLLRHHRAFEACRRRYLAKWGGLPGEETWEVPHA